MDLVDNNNENNLNNLLNEVILSISSCNIFKLQSLRFKLQLELLKLTLNSISSSNSSSNERINKLIGILNKYLELFHTQLKYSLNELISKEKYLEITNFFLQSNQEIIILHNQLTTICPSSIIFNSWYNIVDSFYDWNECFNFASNNLQLTNILKNCKPLLPKFRQFNENILLINPIKSLLDYDQDDEEDGDGYDGQLNNKINTNPQCIAGYFAIFKESPVHLKLISSEVLSQNNTYNLYEIAYTLQSIPRSDYLQRYLAISTETSHLQYHTEYTFQSSSTLPSSTNPTLSIISLLAPLGSLKSFLSNPPDEILVHELTQVPTSRMSGGLISPEIKFSILLDICTGLNYLHSLGYVHGRLHHNNVLIYSGYRAKLTDFGISHLISPFSQKYKCNKENEIEIIEGSKYCYKYSGIGNDPRWYAPEIVLRDILQSKDKKYQSNIHNNSNNNSNSNGNGGSGLNLLKRFQSSRPMPMLCTPATDIYGFGMLIFSVVTDGSCPFFNMIWEEAVVNALYRGERPTFPSHIPFKAILDPLVNEDNGFATLCWSDNPKDRPNLSSLESEFKSVLIELMVDKEHRLKVRAENDITTLENLIQEKNVKIEAGDKRIAEAKEIIKGKETEMNAKKLASEKRQLQAVLDKAIPRLDSWIQTNNSLKAEVASHNNEILKLKTLIKESENRLLGGKNFILRHRAWIEDYNIINLITKYAQDSDKEWLKSEYKQKHVLESLIYELSGPLNENDSLDQDLLLSFQQVHKVPSITDFYINSIYNGYQEITTSTNSLKSTNETKSSILTHINTSSSSSSSASSTIIPLSNSSNNQNIPKPIPSPTSSSSLLLSSQPGGKRRQSLNKYYENNITLRRSNTGSSNHSKDTDGERDSIFVNNNGGNRLNSKDSEKEEYLTIPRYPINLNEITNISYDINLCDIYDDINEDFLPSDSLEFQYFSAIRGDIQEARELYKLETGTAINRGEIQEIISLIENEETRDQIPPNWFSPCHLASSLGHLSVLTSLIETLSYSPNHIDHMGKSLLLTACTYGHLPIVRYLVESFQVDITQSDKNNMTPILTAASMGFIDIVSYLHQRLDSNNNNFYEHKVIGGSILHWACLCGASLSINYGICSNDSRYLETIQYIVTEMKCPINIRSSIDQSTPLLWATSSPPSNIKLKIIEWLLQTRADMNIKDSGGRNILFYSVLSDDLTLVKILIEKYKISINVKDSSGKTPLQLATNECEAYLKTKTKGKRFSLI